MADKDNNERWIKVEPKVRSVVVLALGEEFASKANAVVAAVKTTHDKIVRASPDIPETDSEVKAIVAAWVAAFNEKFGLETLVASLLRKSNSLAYQWNMHVANVEDLIQEAAKNAVRAFGSQPQGFLAMDSTGFRAWFRTVLGNVRLDHYRKNSRYVGDGIASSEDPNDVLSTDNIQQELEFRDRLKACLHPREYEVFVLRQEEGLSVPEIADKLGVSEKTVSRDYKSAKVKARKEFGS